MAFCVRRPLHCLLSRQAEIFYCLLGVTAAAVVMGQITVVVFQLLVIERLDRFPVRSCKALRRSWRTELYATS